jgi:hypothetical protein
VTTKEYDGPARVSSLDLQQDSVGISEKKGVLMDGKYKFINKSGGYIATGTYLSTACLALVQYTGAVVVHWYVRRVTPL